ncbi:hypothetical protein [Candidatus Coxiella mudrowiae]|uniref:hypothetical protein n=1 Tax=Candidatus Coxiella mudrowiae TaxID=2054173 RepID=UPI001F20E9D4|nr:hypothetical protein [Candidatus Coxiella mudrowiae]
MFAGVPTYSGPSRYCLVIVSLLSRYCLVIVSLLSRYCLVIVSLLSRYWEVIDNTWGKYFLYGSNSDSSINVRRRGGC